MSFKATLNIDNRTLNILYCEYDFMRHVNKNLFPVSYPQSGFVKIFLEAQRDDFFESWSISATQKKSGSIIFYKRDNLSILKQLVMSDVYCVSFKEKYESLGHHPFYLEVKLSAGELRYGESVYRNHWFINEGEEKDLNGKQTERSYGNTQKPSSNLRKEEPTAGNAVTNNSNIVPSGSVPEESVNSMELDEVVVTGEELKEHNVVQKVSITSEEPGFLKKYLVKPLKLYGGSISNSVINRIAVDIVSYIPTSVATYLSDNIFGNQKLVHKSWDGKILHCENCNTNNDCGINPKIKNNGSPTIPLPGKRPINSLGNSCSSKGLKKVYYINGIQTDPKTSCTTSKLMAKDLCVEVNNVYNRTEGMVGDLMECIRSIRKGKKVPPTDAMVELLESHFGTPPMEPYEELNLMAHSQGGLITQHALIRYKEDLIQRKIPLKKIDQIMGNVKVKSFGTAQGGWPSGPEYEQFTNIYDPVPHVIYSAQLKYSKKTFTSDSFLANIKNNIIEEPHFDPIGSHNMDKIYLPKLKETSKNNIVDKCKSCKN